MKTENNKKKKLFSAPLALKSYDDNILQWSENSHYTFKLSYYSVACVKIITYYTPYCNCLVIN